MKLTGLTILQLEEQLQNCLELLEADGGTWAKDKASYEDLEDKRKPMLASLMSRFEGAQSFKEQQAYSAPEWQVYLNGLSEARKRFYKAQVSYELSKLRIDVIRSLMSTRREEVKNFRG